MESKSSSECLKEGRSGLDGQSKEPITVLEAVFRSLPLVLARSWSFLHFSPPLRLLLARRPRRSLRGDNCVGSCGLSWMLEVVVAVDEEESEDEEEE